MGRVRAVYKRDGTVAVIIPAPKSKKRNETERQWLTRIFDKAISLQPDLQDVFYDDIDDSQLPRSRQFRAAWTGRKQEGVHVDAVRRQEIIDRVGSISSSSSSQSYSSVSYSSSSWSSSSSSQSSSSQSSSSISSSSSSTATRD
jgi:hypothetical protein